MTTTVYTPQVGDRVVVESPVFFVGDEPIEHFLRDSPKVGDVFTVQSVEGDYLGLSGSWASHVDAVLPLEDLDLIAAERALPIGTRVRVVRNVLADGTPGALGDLMVGNEGTVTGYARYFGGIEIRTDNPGATELHPDAYEIVEEAAPLTEEAMRRGAAVALAFLILGPDALAEEAVAVASFILGEDA